jgi:membrane-bound metal-dependent hydrolase YbcI (DUF457 family)
MSNRKEHDVFGILFGALAAGGTAFAQGRNPTIAEVVGGSVGGLLGSRLPDQLEPPTSPNHRAFAHSKAFAVTALPLAGVVASKFQQAMAEEATGRESNSPEAAALGRFFGGLATGSAAGYSSHLALDATTPKGLPTV